MMKVVIRPPSCRQAQLSPVSMANPLRWLSGTASKTLRRRQRMPESNGPVCDWMASSSRLRWRKPTFMSERPASTGATSWSSRPTVRFRMSPSTKTRTGASVWATPMAMARPLPWFSRRWMVRSPSARAIATVPSVEPSETTRISSIAGVALRTDRTSCQGRLLVVRRHDGGDAKAGYAAFTHHVKDIESLNVGRGAPFPGTRREAAAALRHRRGSRLRRRRGRRRRGTSFPPPGPPPRSARSRPASRPSVATGPCRGRGRRRRPPGSRVPHESVSSSTPRSKVRISIRSTAGKRTKLTLVPGSPKAG